MDLERNSRGCAAASSAALGGRQAADLGGAAVRRSGIDYRDVQGVVRFGYKHLQAARYLVLRVRESAAARAWLRQAPVTGAEFVHRRRRGAARRVQRAGPRGARRAAGRAGRRFRRSSSAGWPTRTGRAGWATRRQRARALAMGRRGRRAPRAGDVLHAAADRSTPSRPRLTGAAFARRVRGAAAPRNQSDLDGVEPFGFADGISQPAIDWDAGDRPGDARASTTATSRRSASSCSATATSTASSRTGRWSAPTRRSAALPDALDDAGKKDVGRNGTYLVFRQLGQDVRAFWQFVSTGHRRGCRPRWIGWRRPSSADDGRRSAGAGSARPFPAPDRTRPGAAEPVHLRRRSARRRLSVRARTSAARTRATPITRAGRPA